MRTSVASFSSLIHALCVGVDDPGDPDLPRLGTAESDASELAAALMNPGGCAVPANQVHSVTGKDATRDSILTPLRAITSSAAEQDAIVVYLAGHALQRDGEFFFCPSGIDWAKPSETALRGSDINDCIKATKARGVLLILDCCQSAGFAENAPESFRSLGTGEYRIVLAASRANQRSWEMRDGHGTLFSRNLIDIVSGDILVGPSPGTVYFSDLLQTIQDRMEEQRESLGQDLPPQQPVFAGVYTQDPLLFVHRQLTLEQVKLTTARYSPAYVRRKVRNWLMAVVVAVYFSATVYYGFLRSSQYGATVGDKIAIFRGYHGLGAPGYPVHLWTLSYGAERLKNRPTAGAQVTWVAPLGKPVLPILDRATRADFLAARAAHEGKSSDARTLSLSIIDNPKSHGEEEILYATLVFCTVATTDDIARLHALLGSKRNEIRLAAAERLSTLDQEYIYPIAEKDLPAGDSFPHEDFLRHIRGGCNVPLQHYLDSLLSIDSNVPTTKQVLDTALRTGCSLSVPALVTGVTRPQMWGEVDVARFAALEKEDAQLAEALLQTLRSARLDVVRRQTLIGTLAALPHPPCMRDLAGTLQRGPWWVSLEESYALSRGCPEFAFTMGWADSQKELQFNLAKDGKPVWALNLNPAQSDYRNAFPFLINVSERDRRLDVMDSLAHIVEQVNDDYVRARALVSLNSLGFDGAVNESLIDGNNLEVRRATYELVRTRDASKLIPRLMSRIGGADEFYEELLGRMHLSEDQPKILRSRLGGSVAEQQQAACVLAMQDAPARTVELLTSPDAEIRESAGKCAAYHAQAPAILSQLEAAKVDFPLESIADLKAALNLKDSLVTELNKLGPDEREWRLKLLDDQPWGLLPQALRYWVREQVFQARIANRQVTATASLVGPLQSRPTPLR